jgi:uncharacterized protein (DUF1501 family)
MDQPIEYLSAANVAAMTAAAAANGGTDYKALVCLYFYGGADTHNMLVPTTHPSSAATRAAYDGARPVGVRILSDEAPTNYLGDNFTSSASQARWRVHPKLQVLSDAWTNNGSGERLAVVRHVGTLDRPLTKTEYQSNVKARPDQLFAHNIQQDLWMAADVPDKPRTTGWFGRAANLLDPYFNPAQRVGAAAFSTSGNALQGFAYADKKQCIVPPSVFPSGVSHSLGNFDEMRRVTADYRLDYPYRNNVVESFYTIRNAAIDAQGLVNSGLQALPTTQNNVFEAVPTTISFGTGSTTGAKEGLRLAARIIHSRNSTSPQFQQRRQMIFVGIGGWDHHSTLRTSQDRYLEHLHNALDAFWTVMGQLGLTNNVVVFTETEFSRTLTSNGTLGTDHAWAAHHFVMGGAVVPGFYGPEPDYTINGPRDTGQGRFIPDVSIEQYYATMLKWFGVPIPQLPLILPNLPAFSPSTLGFLP